MVFNLKKILLISFLFCCVSCFCFSQGDLQYNRTVFIEKTSTPILIGSNYVYDSLDIIVPINKTLKIESVFAGGAYELLPNKNFSTTSNCYVSINDAVIYIDNPNYSNGANFPIWLPHGSYRVKITSGNVGVSTLIKTSISGIEFNIIP